MATVKKLIGRLPVYKGDWVAGTYSMLNQVSYLGSTFQSKIDNNTSQPATVVNNELQINSNWSVVSNGTAAYLSGSRLTTVEEKNAQLEQEVNIVRGDVQGLRFLGDRDVVCNKFDIIGGVAFSAWVYPTGGDKGIISLSSGDNYARYPAFHIFSYANGSLECSLVPNKEDDRLVVYAHNKVNKPVFVAFNFFERNLEIWIDGVLVGKKINAGWLTTPLRNLFIGSRGTDKSICSIYNVRMFNVPFTQSIVDYLYNQGRCDEVVLGDEWRGTYKEMIPTATDFGKVGESYVSGSGLNYTLNVISSDGELSQCHLIAHPSGIRQGDPLVIEFDLIGSGSVVLENTVSGIFTATSTLTHIIAYGKLNTVSNNIMFKRWDGPCNIQITNVSVRTPQLLNEYLPSFLSPTKWIDNGVNKQDIPLTAPTFTYIKPYKQYSFGSGVPATPPDAAHTEYTDVATGNIWKCGGKPNTRQFAVTDWKQINN